MKSLENNVISFVEKNVLENPDKIAFIYSKEADIHKISNKDFYEKVLKFATVLKKNGIKKGDRVIIFLPISVELYIILAALQVIGGVPVFLESWSKIQHIRTSIKNASPKGIISLSKLFEKYGFFFRNFSFRMSIDSKKKKKKVLSFYEELEKAEKNNTIELVGENDTALITYTTGSSGEPKGADRTHKFLKSQHFALDKIFPYSEDDIDMPIFPVFALNNLAGGVTTVIPDIMSSDNLSDEDIQKLVNQIIKLKINNLTLSPIIFNKLTKFAQKNNLIFSDIKRVLTGGAPISENDVIAFKKIVPKAKIWILYGSTEVEPISYIEADEMVKIMNNLKNDEIKNKTSQGVVVGKIHDDLEFAFIKTDFDNFEVGNIEDIYVDENKIGELVVSGKHVCEKYYKNENAFKRAKIVDKNKKVWHRTGDIGRLDKDKNLWIVGRKHNLIKKDNEIYFPVRPEILLKEITGAETAAYLQTKIKNEEKIFIVLEGIYDKKNIEKVSKKFQEEKIPFDKIIFVDKIIMDIRHHSKVNYSEMKKLIQKDTKINRWIKFLKERFCVLQILPIVIVFALAHLVILKENFVFDWKIIFLILITLLFFLKLRLYDEIKDFKTDLKVHPERPLPRGLLKKGDLKKIILSIIILEILFFGFFGINSFFFILITIFYSLLMYKEFFISNWIRKYLTFYAVTHTFVVSLFSLSIFSIFNKEFLLDFDLKLIFFALGSWFIFNVFEFGRKTFSEKEEKKEIDSYSKNFTLSGALMLNLTTSFVGLYLIFLSLNSFQVSGVIIFLILLVLSLLFLVNNKFSKIYRFYTTFIIFIIYLSIVVF